MSQVYSMNIYNKRANSIKEIGFLKETLKILMTNIKL